MTYVERLNEALRLQLRRPWMNVSDEIAAKVDVRFYTDARDAFLKAIAD